MLVRFHDRLVFDAEPGAAAGEAPPAPATSGSEPNKATPPATDGQQAPPEGGTEQSPPPDDGSKPAEGEGTDPPKDELADLPDETIANLIEVYGDKWREHPKFKEWVASEAGQLAQQQSQEQARRPEADPVYRAMQAEAADAYNGVVSLLQKLDAGEDVDGRSIAGKIAATNEFTAATARREMYAITEHVLTDTIVGDGKPPPQDDPVHKEVDQARANYVEALGNVHRLRNSEKPENRAKAAQAETQALEQFTAATHKIAYEAGKRAGEKMRDEKAEKQTAARIALAKDNAFKEAAARHAAGGNPTNGGKAKEEAKPQLTRDNLLAGDWRKTRELMRKDGAIK